MGQSQLKWNKNNPNKTSSSSKKWKKKNLQKVRRIINTWNEKNRDKRRGYDNYRRALKQLSTIGNLEQISKIYSKCQKWRSLGFDVEVDHKIPLSKGGSHVAENLQIIYQSENAQKRNSLDFHPSVIFS